MVSRRRRGVPGHDAVRCSTSAKARPRCRGRQQRCTKASRWTSTATNRTSSPSSSRREGGWTWPVDGGRHADRQAGERGGGGACAGRRGALARADAAKLYLLEYGKDNNNSNNNNESGGSDSGGGGGRGGAGEGAARTSNNNDDGGDFVDGGGGRGVAQARKRAAVRAVAWSQ